jgi:hypothetical protein
MIILGEFEDPDWLSIGMKVYDKSILTTLNLLSEARDLIKNVLQKDVMKRLTIPQILAHPWFTARKLTYDPEPGTSETSTLSTADSLFVAGTSTTPTTPDETPDDPFDMTPLHRNPSETTLRKPEPLNLRMTGNQPETVQEEDDRTHLRNPTPPRHNSSGSSKAPPAHPVRTPARTKRRSVSSTLSDPASPTADKTSTPLPPPSSHDFDFASLLSTPTPIIFSTPVERELLNTLSMLGFDTAQIVHSVLSDACDAAGAVWWMLKKKAEKRHLEEGDQGASPYVVPSPLPTQEFKLPEVKSGNSKSKKRRIGVGVQTEPGGFNLSLARSAPQLAFVPPTPTFSRPMTPPRPTTPTRSLLLSPSSSTVAGDSSSKSHPSTPASSLRDREGKGRKARSGSVSIMQRATTALEAAGLVRKKSSEAVREEKDRERERERSKDMERRIASGEESRSSHGSGSSKLTKSPPLKASKEYTPSTPPPSEANHSQPPMDSPWVMADTHDSLSRQHGARVSTSIPVNPPGEMQHSHSTPNFSETTNVKPTASVPHRNRANLLTTFRLWFHEDRKGKRKDNSASNAGNSHVMYSRPLTTSGQPFGGSSKRRGSGSSGKFAPKTGGHRHRPSVSSRRSSSVNSRRSSGTSVQMLVIDSPQVATRRSFGSHTPNSERGDYSSRPSSIRSFSMQPRHRKSPSASSAGSTHLRTTSPMQKYHRRAGSGSSTTRVVRQVQTTPRPPHMRSNSATSSLHSPTSSRPASYYGLSEDEGPRTTSPYKSRTRRSMDDAPRRPPNNPSSTTFIAQKRQGPFISPVTHGYGSSFGRSSWKKSWGLEPPGWQTRTTHLPIEVLAVSPATEPVSIRDVFSGRQSLNLGDESDWVDEDDDIPAFAGGLGQMGTPATSSAGISLHSEPPVTLSPAPRGHRSTKRVNRNTSSSGSASGGSSRQKPGHSPIERASPIPPDNVYEPTETRSGRRQLPAGRSGPAFRHAIQEEDEGEEE